MRFFPLLTAALVSLTLYLIVMERDALLAFAGGERAEADVRPAAVSERRPVPVRVREVHLSDVSSGIVLRGRTEATRKVELRAETGGLVVTEPLRAGAFVSEGDTLCQLDPGTRQAALDEAEARLEEAIINNRAAEDLAERGFGAENRAVSSRAALASARAAAERARRELELLTIRAPFDAMLEIDAAERGALLQPGGLCAALVTLDPVRFVGFLPESEVDRVELGALAGARLLSGREVAGRVSFLARQADPATRTFRVEVSVPNPDYAIREGVTAEILVQAESARAHLVPQSALTLDDAGRLGVRLAEDGRARFKPVRILRDDPEGVWVLGLPEIAPVIVLGQEFVTDGAPVEVAQEGAE
ncbi:MAG: efflux RND transporter periplasmic adaptor subunit [Rhodobacteraceae bacterium]|nr:efflux RND transporter periplasmic adaptor subunit [Paracoccaceae bacterium]